MGELPGFKTWFHHLLTVSQSPHQQKEQQHPPYRGIVWIKGVNTCKVPGAVPGT